MGIKTIKVLRTISKVVLAVFVLAFVGYGGLVTYKSIINRPQRVRITNVTDSAATITWVTKNPVRGVVYYNESGFFLPGPLSFIFGKAAYDDRDVSAAQEACVTKFNENAKNTKDANFSVDGSNFDCENTSVGSIGVYYTHSITIPNLREETKYSFRVGNGIWSWDYDGVGKDTNENDLPLAIQFNFSTEKTSETVPTPNIAYGTVYAANIADDGKVITEAESKDSLVFAYLTIEGVNSQPISSVTNTDGGWILDKSNFRDSSGSLITDLSSAKLTVCAQYESVAPKTCLEVQDDLDKDTNVDLLGNIVNDLSTYEKNQILKKFDDLLGKVYAFSNPDPTKYSKCEQKGVDGCNGAASKCAYKCYLIGSTNFDWKTGTETVGSGACELPYSCGCPATGQCENKCVNGASKKRTCNDTGGYKAWSAYSAGVCPGESDPCTGGGGTYCSDSGKCDGAPQNDNSDGKCLNGTINEGEKCPNNQGTCLDGVCVPETKDFCADGTTKVGYCTYGSKKCTTKGGALEVSNSCKCKDGNNLVIVGGCIGLTQHTCGITSNGSVAPTVSMYNGCPSEETVPKKCTLKPEYIPCPAMEDAKCLDHCILNCTDGSKTLGLKECNKLASFAQTIVKQNEAYDQPVQVVQLDTGSMGQADLNLLADVAPDIRAGLNQRMKLLISEINSWKCDDPGNVESQGDEAKSICKALDGKWKVTYDLGCQTRLLFEVTASCSDVVLGASVSDYNLISKIYAQDNSSDGYTLYLPEYGMYSFEIGNYSLTTDTIDGETYYIFYIETNGKDGFQIPSDLDNPTSDEDIMLRSDSAMITYEKVSSAQTYAIAKGINLVSFNFVPVSTELGALTADGVIKEAAKNNVTIKYISTFDGGRWSSGYSCQTEPCTGNDFTIVPGKGYLIYANNSGDITIPGYNLKSSIPVAFSSGWNLVGIHGYTTAYTARTLIDSINTIDGLTANNVSWWPTSKGKYEGLQVENGTEYGLDFAISPTNGYFVRISEFAPTDTTCKSILWNDGGTLNGTCGNTK